MRIRVLGGLLAAILAGAPLAACGEGPAGAAATAPAQAGGAEAFVRSLYATEAGGTGDASEDGMFSARTAALVAETEALGNPGEYAYFEADPVCACQDDGGMVLRGVTVTSTGADTADAAVVMEWTMAEPVQTIRQTFNLVREGGAWAIDDIQRDQSLEFPQAPLVQDMTRWIAERRAETAATGGA